MRVSGSSELQRSADASLLVVEVLRNLSDFEFRVVHQNHEDEKNSSEFFEAILSNPVESAGSGVRVDTFHGNE
jgi:hypothetical protein